MSAYCPECETDLDQATGICPACRWDPMMVARSRPATTTEPERSLTERYRGTDFDILTQDLAVSRNGVSRGRLFVVVGLVGAAALYATGLMMMGPVL